MAKSLSSEDLAHTAKYAKEAFLELSNAQLFLTGGTGFFGHWLLESLLHANKELGLNLHVTVLTRSPQAFQQKAPHIAVDPVVHLLAGDVRNFDFPTEKFTHIIHAATDSGGQQALQSHVVLAESIVQGTRRILQFAVDAGVRRFLYASSGGVYGRNITSTIPILETFSGGPDPLQLNSSHDEAKRMAEHFCIAYAEGATLEPVIARCFAFVGPHLPLNQHFAIGNFIHAAMKDDSIEIRGDGTPRRSWLYAADLAVWLWTLLVQGQSGRAYNVGSDEDYSIDAAANIVAKTLRPDGRGGSTLPVHMSAVADRLTSMQNYVPSIDRAYRELGLKVRVPLVEAIRRTAAWHAFSVDRGRS